MANTDTKLGIVAILPVGAWVSASTYEYLNLVTYGGGAYLALQDVPSGTALSNTSYWLQITEKGLKGDKGDKGDTGAKGDTGNGIASVTVEEVSVSGAEHNYRMTVTMTDGTVTTYDYTVTDGAVTSVNGRTGAVIGLAEQDGYYELMSVGSADQLISTQYIEDSVPYKFRTSGGSADIGDREIDEIVGGTVNWNQLNDSFASWVANDGTLSATERTLDYTVTSVSDSTAGNRIQNSISFLANHKYAILFSIKPPRTNGRNMYLYLGSATSKSIGKPTANVWNSVAVVINATANASYIRIGLACYASDEYAVGDIFSLKDMQVIDLTALFGSPTIADYIYNLEQSTAGAGVAWFKKFFPNDYYPYSVPTLTHVSGLSSHDMVGFNAYDSSTGTAKVVGGQPYQITGTYTSISLDGTAITPDSNGIFTPSANGTLTVVGGNATDTCVHLVWSGTRNGEYEPYVKHSYPLDPSLTLRGIPKLDADGNLYYDGDVYSSDGTVQRRYGIVDLGSLTWAYDSSYTRFRASLPTMINANVRTLSFMCSRYTSLIGGTIEANVTNGVIYNANLEKVIYIHDLAYTDATTFKSAVSGVYLVYELATPTAETAQPYADPQIVNDWGTEEYVSETIVPVGHNTKYTANLRDKLQHLPDLASSDGYYVIQQTGTDMSLVQFRIPKAPTTDGTYTLQATVSGGTPTYTWVADTAESTEVTT